MENEFSKFNLKFLPQEDIYKLFPRQNNKSLVVAFYGTINKHNILVHDYGIPYSSIKETTPKLDLSCNPCNPLIRYMLLVVGFDKKQYYKLLGPKFCINNSSYYYCEPNYINSPEYGPVLNSLMPETLLKLLTRLETFIKNPIDI